MTLPHERTRSVINTRDFLSQLAKGEGSPSEMKEHAKFLLRHYPYDYQVKTAGKIEENPSWISVFGPIFSSTCEWDDPSRGAYDVSHSNDKLEKVFAYQVVRDGFSSEPFERFRCALYYALRILGEVNILVYLKGGRSVVIPKEMWQVSSLRDGLEKIKSTRTPSQSRLASYSERHPVTPLHDLVCIAVGEWLTEEITRMDHVLYSRLAELSRDKIKEEGVDKGSVNFNDESDFNDSVAEVWQEKLEMFGGDSSLAINFLFKRNLTLGERPVDVLLSEPQEVLELIARIEHGIPS